MNGTIGCRSLRAESNECASTARATSPSSPPAASRLLVDSRYQSASSFHTNLRAASVYSLSLKPARSADTFHTPFSGRAGPSAASHSAIAVFRALSIHRSARRSLATSIRWSVGTSSEPTLVSRNRPMFQSFVTKFLPGANDFSRSSGSSMTSAPMPSPAITVYRSASVPNRARTSSGSIPFPRDFDILTCFMSRTVPVRYTV